MPQNFLEIENVTFAASDKNKVNNVPLSIENEGDIVCLLGPSGIGKTTILRTIAGLEKIQSGKISLKNKTISSKNIHVEPENRNISLAFQDNSLFPHYNVIQNIQFGADRNKKKKKNLTINEVIKFLHLDHVKDKFPHQISSGEAQRAALARALLSKPDLLLLDEPLSANDTERRLTMLAQLDTWFSSEPIPVLYVSHAQEELRRLTQQLIIMEQGAVRSRGATEALLNGVTDVDGESSDHSVDEEAIVVVASGDQLSVVLQRAAGTALAEQPDLAPGDRVLIRRVPPDISGRDFTLQPQSDKDESETD